MSRIHPCLLLLLLPQLLFAQERTPIRVVRDAALSPDGTRIVLSWRGDLWSVSSKGGPVKRLTFHPARDRQPRFSPDGREIAFVSSRNGSPQIHVMPAAGGPPRRITLHTEGYVLYGWTPDGKGLLVGASRDHFWRNARRIFIQPLDGTREPELLFDGYGDNAVLDASGTRLLFTREGAPVYRKGYRGSQESQVWLFDRETRSFRQLQGLGQGGCRWPVWTGPETYLYVNQASGAWNLQEARIGDDKRVQLTHFEDDGVLFPRISRDGSTLIFLRRFDLHRFDLKTGKVTRLDIWFEGDPTVEPQRRVRRKRADAAAFTDDGMEIALTAGGDLYVMDTVLKEPIPVTNTPEEERSPVFSKDHQVLYFISDAGGRTDIWRAVRKDEKQPWWRQEGFELEKLTDDEATERDLRLWDEGKRLAYIRNEGDLVSMELATGETRVLVASWNPPSYDFSPDGKWIAYSVADADYNSDVWLKPLDGSRPPYNVSVHPDNDRSPRFSADGKVLAWTGRRWGTESDIAYVYLDRKMDEKTSRERKLEEALKKMKKRGKGKKGAKKKGRPRKEEGEEKPEAEKPASRKSEKKTGKVVVEIDFEGLSDRVRRIAVPNSFERGLLFAPKEAKLYFTATVKGRSGVYTVSFPDKLSPKFFCSSLGRRPRWLEDQKTIATLERGLPATISASGKTTTHAFDVKAVVDVAARNQAVFDMAWRTMRDRFYDERMNNKDWNAVRAKYRPLAATLDTDQLATVANMMLGELNASHLGFSMGRGFRRGGASTAGEGNEWNPVTGHLGTLFDPTYEGPGLRVRAVVRNTPAWREETRIEPGEIILAIDGRRLLPGTEIAVYLTDRPDRDVEVRVLGKDGREREVVLRPTTYRTVRSRMYEDWMLANRRKVERLSDGKLGYLHIRAMGGRNLETFDADLYKIGHGKDGLVIDVRENGGGSITDHLLTCLFQPTHAITRGRGGSEGYPQDRRVYATWDKPIVVLCNQNSFSNAEIFSHAIKTLKRGKLVGTPTAGGVISTGSASLMGLARVRVPMRGWYLLDGEDMERNGCVPDHVIWPLPGEMPAGKDRQLEKAVEVLLEDVKAWKARPRPKLRKASER